MNYNDLFLEAVWYLAWRIGLVLILLYNIPRIVRGTKRIWARNKVRPPLSWWCALPDWCGWGILMTGFAFAGHWLSPPWKWIEIVISLIYIWGIIGLIHGGRALWRWWERRKDVPFRN